MAISDSPALARARRRHRDLMNGPRAGPRRSTLPEGTPASAAERARRELGTISPKMLGEDRQGHGAWSINRVGMPVDPPDLYFWPASPQAAADVGDLHA
jgi:hypothetical protein